jgi:hypothetical protein
MLFHPEFLETGVVRAISEALPFDSIGATTCGTAVFGGGGGDLMLTVTVLTSNEVEFRTGTSLPIKDDPGEPVRELYSRLTSGAASMPSLLFALAPFAANAWGDELIAALDTLSGGVPLFGSLAFTYRPDFSGIETCCNGERYTDALTLIAMFGEVEPEFYLTLVPEDRIIQQNATVTKALKNQIQSINGLAPLKYLESIGLNSNFAAIASIPFVLTLNNGSRIVRSLYGFTDLPDNSLKYQFAYSGGEICPVRNQHGQMVNRFHNLSLTVCLL